MERSGRGVAQAVARHWPWRMAATSKSQTRIPAVSQPSSPRLPERLAERARMMGPTRARQPAMVERLESKAYGGQVSRPRWTSRVMPTASAEAMRRAFKTAG